MRARTTAGLLALTLTTAATAVTALRSFLTQP